MSQTEQQCDCACDHSPFTMLPVRGFGIAVDTSGLLPAPAPEKLCRERVDHDVDIYINGNLETSGDGLTPESAVKSYGDAVLALSRYDGCNLYNAHFHFADLADPKATYPDMYIFKSSYATFEQMIFSGDSHESTRLGKCYNTTGSWLNVTNICLVSIENLTGMTYIRGKVALKPSADTPSSFISRYGGSLCFLRNAEIYLYPGRYNAPLYAWSSAIYAMAPVVFHTLGTISPFYGFAYALAGASILLESPMDFSDCTSVSGKKYLARTLSSISTGGQTLPGSEAGVLQNGSVYI